jgi:type VI secretion system protein ImpB
VMADLSGNASDVAKPAMADRKFANVDMDNFDSYMESVQPAVQFRTENRLADKPGEQVGMKLTFKKMADFEPAAIARQVPALRALLEAREQLSNLQRYMDGKVAAEQKLRELLGSPELMKALSDRRDEAATPAEKSEEGSGE